MPLGAIVQKLSHHADLSDLDRNLGTWWLAIVLVVLLRPIWTIIRRFHVVCPENTKDCVTTRVKHTGTADNHIERHRYHCCARHRTSDKHWDLSP